MAGPNFNRGSAALRNMRRFLQGRGVDLRKAVVLANDNSLTSPVTIPGMGSHDEVSSVLWHPVVGGALVVGIEELNYRDTNDAVQATLAVTPGGANDDYTLNAQAEYPGTEGNAITWTVTGGGAAGSGAKVTVSGAAITVTFEAGTTVNAMIAAIEAHPQARRMVHIELAAANTGVGVLVADVATPLAGGLDADTENCQKVVTAAVQAVLAVAAGGGGNNGYTLTASSEYPGTKGNGATGGLTWTRTGGGAAGTGAVVSVSGRAITVVFETNVTTVNQVIAAVEAHPEARRMVHMKLSGAGPTGAGFIAAAAVANLAGGLDESVALSIGNVEDVEAVMTAADILIVEYLTRA